LRASVERDSQEYLRRLLETNAARIGNDLKQRLDASRQRLLAEMQVALTYAVGAAERAMERARRVQAEGHEQVGVELARVVALRSRLAGLTRSEG
jgi:hypothetical protein